MEKRFDELLTKYPIFQTTKYLEPNSNSNFQYPIAFEVTLSDVNFVS